MAIETTLTSILSDFTKATESATQSLPDKDSVLPPQNGITLLDAKNEIFLSYLQALALRNLNVIRALKDGASSEGAQKLSTEISAKLAEHRVYLERGVRPLEQKIKFQVDRVLKTADDEDRAEEQRKQRKDNANGNEPSKDEDDSEAEDDSDDEDEVDSGADDDRAQARPNLERFAMPKKAHSEQDQQSLSRVDGPYRPPRISATSMPTTERREKKERAPARSRTMDEYVSTEMSSAPMAEPSIGSTIAAGGRRNKDARQLAKEQEKRDYEETNLVRLPNESKKERAKQTARERSRGGFGGEEWTGLGDSADRIDQVTRRKGKDSALEKSRKRRAVEDGPRNDGFGMEFEKKRRRLEKKSRR